MLIPIADLHIQKGPARPRPTAQAEPCLLCGRWLDPGTAYLIELTTGGCVVYPVDPTMASTPDSQGGFYVGPDCFRRVRRYARTHAGSR